MSNESTPGQPKGHLGTSWEIAVVVGFVFAICAVTGTAVYQRRKRRRQRQALLESALGIREGPFSSTEAEPPLPPFTHDLTGIISKPLPSHQSKQPSKDAPEYYWDHR